MQMPQCTHLNFKWIAGDPEWFISTCVLGSILNHDHFDSSTFLLNKCCTITLYIY